jgi:hypothetical protein
MNELREIREMSIEELRALIQDYRDKFTENGDGEPGMLDVALEPIYCELAKRYVKP